MRLFRLQNKSRRQWWVIAVDTMQAKEVSVQLRCANSIGNLQVLDDHTDHYLSQRGGDSLAEHLKAGRPGLAVQRVGKQVTWQLTHADIGNERISTHELLRLKIIDQLNELCDDAKVDASQKLASLRSIRDEVNTMIGSLLPEDEIVT